jgi:hypothetical protein
MMRPHLFARLLPVLALLSGGAALAQPPKKKLPEFHSEEMTDAERDAADKSRPRFGVNAYNKDVPIETSPIPWMAIGLGGAALLIAVPFAIRAYVSTTKDIADVNTFGVSDGGEGEDRQ